MLGGCWSILSPGECHDQSSGRRISLPQIAGMPQNLAPAPACAELPSHLLWEWQKRARPLERLFSCLRDQEVWSWETTIRLEIIRTGMGCWEVLWRSSWQDLAPWTDCEWERRKRGEWPEEELLVWWRRKVLLWVRRFWWSVQMVLETRGGERNQ